MNILIADKHFLSSTGLEHLVHKHFNKTCYMTSQAQERKILAQQIKVFQADIVLLDYNSMQLSPEDVRILQLRFPNTKFIFITEWLPKSEFIKYLRTGIKWHLLKECDEAEIKECIEYAANNQSFFCNKLIQFMQRKEEMDIEERRQTDCSGIGITQREREIIQMIAEGMSNKQIADALHLSIHTVLTHRKNIMKKTSANNTAGLVLFALKNRIIESSNHFLFAKKG